MDWLMMTLFSAVLMGIQPIFSKQALIKVHASQFGIMHKLFEFVILLFFVPYALMPTDIMIYVKIAFFALLASVAYLLSLKSLRHLEISNVMPLTNLAPIFVFVFAYIFIGERLSTKSVIATLIIISGMLLIEHHKLRSALHSFKRGRYLYYILFSSMIVGMTVTFDKYVISQTTPLIALFLIWTFMFIYIMLFSAVYFKEYFKILSPIKKAGIPTAAASLFSVGAAVFYYNALTLAPATLVIAVKRTSTLFQTILGGAFFHEKHILLRSAGCCIMILGAMLML